MFRLSYINFFCLYNTNIVSAVQKHCNHATVKKYLPYFDILHGKRYSMLIKTNWAQHQNFCHMFEATIVEHARLVFTIISSDSCYVIINNVG